ncbi:MAG: hypothetical protein V7636_249 [Actinomycetota bacterium]
MRIGIAHHLGWAIVVAATADHHVVDRRRIELIADGVPSAPVEHDIHGMDAAAAARLVAKVRASARKTTATSLDALAAELPEPITSMSVRSWPLDFPDDIAMLRCAPYNSRADSVMYLQVLAEVAHERGWMVHTFDAAGIERQAAAILGDRADDVLHGPRARLGPPWAKDHRMALAATILAG